MAGGRGTRINELFPNIPKPLIPIRNQEGIEKPVLEWEIRSLVDQGFTNIVLTVSYMADKIKTYFGTGEQLGAKITYFVEETPLGNAGALFKMRSEIGYQPFLLINADAVFDVDFSRMVRFHKKCGGLITLFTHPNNHPYDSGLIIASTDGAVEGWLAEEDSRPQWYKNRVNAGLHVIDPKVLDLAAEMNKIDEMLIGTKDKNGIIRKVDLDRQILKQFCGTGKMFCYESPEYIKDMGTPERYEIVCRDFENGVVTAKNLNRVQKAIFFDRDGTINKYVGFLRNANEFELIPGAVEAIRLVNSSGYLAIVVTNQPVIARGEVTISQLQEIHNKMETLLGVGGAYIDALYYCPHHPESGYEGEVKEFKIDCECRKPKPGMLLSAASDFNIELENSWMIGDREIDVLTGKNAGCKTVLIGDSEEFGQDITAENLLTAVKKILGK